MNEKRALRHRQTGDLGFMVDEDGVKFVKYDRPTGPTVPYRPNDWMEEENRPPLNRSQLARVAFAADRQLLYFTNQYGRAKRTWDALTDQERIHWAKHGPDAEDKTRVQLFKSIMKCLEPLTVT